jgi:hypothetical protein
MFASLILFAALSSSAPEQMAGPVVASAQVRPIPAEAMQQNLRLTRKLSPTATNKVRSEAVVLRATFRQQPTMTPVQLQSKARAAVTAAFPGIAGQDVDAVAFLVMMQATHDQDADIQQAMADMRKTTAAKQAIRNAQGNSEGQMSEMSTQMQVELQMSMDRRSKFLEAMSNLLKAAANTDAAIVANLK